jgi:hypothetical protein
MIALALSRFVFVTSNFTLLGSGENVIVLHNISDH